MSSSILLEGQIEAEDGDISSCGWSGQWHFFKDNKIPLNFRYKRVSGEIPLDLVHYVSFIANASGDVTAKPRSRGRAKGWRKYRDQQSAEANSSTTPKDTAVKVEKVEERASSDSAGAVAENPVKGGKEKQVLLELSSEHPLFGLYVGSFDIKSAQGAQAIQETFFLHTYAGGVYEPPPGLDVLPPTDWWTSAQLLKHMDLDNHRIFGDMAKDRSFSADKADAESGIEHDAYAVNAAAAAAAVSEATESMVIDMGAIGNNVSDSNSLVTPKASSGQGEDNGSESKARSSTGDLASYPDLQFMLGFGRNTFGRFSLFGVYNDSTKELKCERKYLTGRTSGLKRNIRPGSFSGPSVSGDQSGEGTPGEPRMTTRTHRVPSFYLPDETVTTPRQQAQEKKQRSYSSLSLSSEDQLISQPTKRRRTQSSAGDLQGAGNGAPHPAPSGRGRSSSTANGENPTSLVESDRQFNDPNNTEIRYRPVYYDEETSSYYEGWWASGCRNGRGLCLYSDKLMYEGNWFMGRETGRGVLMTGNRKVLYRGDWVDGCFHGNGTYTFMNGDTYKGDWREGKRHGKGEYHITKYGCTYIGDWKDNRRHGRGVFIWADGSKYDGDWEKDFR